jgi:hypothetical protein
VKDVIYDDSKSEQVKYHFKYLIPAYLGAFILLIIYLLILWQNNFKFKFLDPSIIALIGSVSLLLVTTVGYIFNKRFEKQGKAGIRVNSNGLYIGRIAGKNTFVFNEIEFVLFDESYKEFLVKTTNTKHIEIYDQLLQNPKKFWLKIPIKERYNGYGINSIADKKKLVDVLKYYGVKIYLRRANKELIEEL